MPDTPRSDQPRRASLPDEVSEPHPDEAPRPAGASQAWHPTEGAAAFIPGAPASPGIAIGPIFRFTPESLIVGDEAGDPGVERARFEEVLAAAHEELERLGQSASMRALEVEADIFKVHQALLSDPELIADVIALINQGHAAAWSWQRIIERRAVALGRAKDERIASRSADLRDIGQRVLRLLTGVASHGPQVPARACILVADDLTPSDTVRIPAEKVLGLCTAKGGPMSHTAIIARSRGLPAIVGAGPRVLSLADGVNAVLDGAAGRLYPEPAPDAVASAQVFREGLLRRELAFAADRFRPAILSGGHRVEIGANIAGASEAKGAVEAGADGVGLLRTEFLFLGRERAPTEQEQFEVYAEILRVLEGRPLVLRTLDVGGDKEVPYIGIEAEQNPFLGVRGIRLCLRRPDIFRAQLRAVYRAAEHVASGALKIMFPMVATLDEFRAARALAESVRADLEAPACPLGMMIEVPSAAVLAAEFAREADFFSVGSNDLTQYTLAMDRQHRELGREADALNPAVLRLINHAVRGARGIGKWIGVCGDLAGDPLGASILAGLGVNELSMTPRSIARVKTELRGRDVQVLRSLARRALTCSTAAEVRALAIS